MITVRPPVPGRQSLFLLLLATFLIAVTGSAFADTACTTMEVYLGIAPKHRDDVLSYIAPRLKAKFGVNLVAEELGSTDMIQRISAQGSSPHVTIAHWDVPLIPDACGRGLCKPIDLSQVPNASHLYDWAIIKDAKGTPIGLTSNVAGIGLIYNVDEFKRHNIAPPTSWADLGRPELKGRVSITSPLSTFGTADLVMLARMHGGGETDIDPGFKAVQALLPNMDTIHTWTSELSNLMQLDEVWLATTGSNLVPPLRDKGVPVAWVAPKEGAPALDGGISLIAGAPCEKEAYAYLDLYFSDAFQLLRAQDGGAASPSRTAWEHIPPELRTKLGMTPDEFPHLVQLDWSAINARRPGWLDRWQHEIH